MSHIKKNVNTTSFPVLQTGTNKVITCNGGHLNVQKCALFPNKAGFEVGRKIKGV